MSKLVRMSVSLEEDLLRRFDRHVKREGYPTRSEAMKALMRQGLVEREWDVDGHVAGAVTLVYDHHKRGLSRRLTDIQHDFGPVIISTQHVHLDHDHCMEVIVVRGKASRIHDLVAALKSIKGIMHHSLSMTSAGRRL